MIRPSAIPLSDGLMNGINKWTHPLSCLYFRSQRNEHEFFWKHDIGIKMPTVTQTRALVSLPPTIFSCAGSYLVCRRVCGWGASFSHFTGGGPTVKHIKCDHLSPGSSPGVAWLSVAL